MRIPSSQLTQLLAPKISSEKTQEQSSELNEARKKDPALDRALYAADMAKMHADIAKADTLARKAARGETLDDEEQAFMTQEAPEKLREAEKAKQRAKEIVSQARQARTPEEAAQILAQAATEMSTSIKNGNLDYAQFLSEALQGETKDGDNQNPRALSSLTENILAQHANGPHRALYRVDTKA